MPDELEIPQIPCSMMVLLFFNSPPVPWEVGVLRVLQHPWRVAQEKNRGTVLKNNK